MLEWAMGIWRERGGPGIGPQQLGWRNGAQVSGAGQGRSEEARLGEIYVCVGLGWT